MKKLLCLACVLAVLLLANTALAENLPIVVAEKCSLYIESTARGPAVTKLIMELPRAVQHITMDEVLLTINDRTIPAGGIYLCDAQGQKTAGASDLLAFEISVEDNLFTPTEYSVINADLLTLNEHLRCEWAKTYRVRLWAPEVTADGEKCSLYYAMDYITGYTCPDAELFNYRSEFSGVYVNSYSRAYELQTLQLAAYEPESLAGGERNPLIIYLHGQSDGGTDVNIALLGTQVSALAKEPIQSCFTAGEQTGAYVLVYQCPTYWMDEGNGRNSPGGGTSRYTQILMDAINDYLAHNPDADPNRIYIGGCSNGGYMTMNMLVSYPGVFAAAYPLCEIYSYYLLECDGKGDYITEVRQSNRVPGDGSWGGKFHPFERVSVDATEALGFDESRFTRAGVRITQEQLTALAQTPIWFVSSIDDDISKPLLYLLPTYRALLQAGAENCHLSLFESRGHAVWEAFFQGQVTGVQDGALLREGEIPLAQEAVLADYAITPNDQGGGSLTVDGYDNIFAWLNAQSK